MKLGIFDSGLGGLLIAKSIRQALPDIDILYFGDTLHLPYGNRSDDAIYAYSKRAIELLFEEGCNLIITACNTVSASALRRLQQQYLPNSPYKDRRILGVIVPTLEHAIDHGYKNLGLIATNYTITSNIYAEELKKLDKEICIHAQNTPLLVPMIENDGIEWISPILENYLNPLINSNIECLILGCTHYPFLKNQIKEICGADISLITQDEIIPNKLEDYLKRHPEIHNNITKNGLIDFYVSDLTSGYISAAHKIYGEEIDINTVSLSLDTNSYIKA